MSRKEYDQAAEVLQGKKILVIDDMQVTRQSMRNIFELANTSITTANNGQDALELLVEDPNFDLIITDFQMPHVNGLEFLQTILENPKITTCKTFILQTSTLSTTIIKAVEDLNEKFQAIHPDMSANFLYKSYDSQSFFRLTTPLLN